MAFDRAFMQLVGMPWETITIETMGEALAAMGAANRIYDALEAPRRESTDDMISTLESIVRRGEADGLTVSSPKPTGYDVFSDLARFYEYRFAIAHLAWVRACNS